MRVKKYIFMFTISIAFFITSLFFKANIYPILAIILPLILFFFEKKEASFLYIIIIIIIINIEYMMFVNYMIHPWFVEDPYNCDGPCFGWYKFESSIFPNILLHNILLIVSLLIVLFSRYIKAKLAR